MSENHGKDYLWNIIHCDTETMLSCVSFSDDNFDFSASSVNDILDAGDRKIFLQVE